MNEHGPCGCVKWCGDLAEQQDRPFAVCKGLREKPKPPLVEVVLVPRAALPGAAE